MKQRYAENFLFPQGKEDFGRSLNFPQGNLHGLGSAMTDALAAQAASYGAEAQQIAAEIAALQSQLYQGSVNTVTLQQATALLQAQGYYQPGMSAESIAATAHALNPDVYVSGAGTGYGTAGSESNPQILARIDQLNQAYQNAVNIVSMSQQQLPIVQAQDEAAAQIAAQQAADQIAQQRAAAAAAAVPAAVVVSAAASAAATAATTNAATVQKPTTIPAVTIAPAAATNYKYTLDFYGNEFWFKRNDGVAISNGSADWKSAALYLGGKYALSDVTVTPAAAAQFARNSGTLVTQPVATSTTVTGTTTTTNQTTGTTTVTNPTTGVTATTNPATGTTTVVATESIVAGSLDAGKIALFALLGVLLLRGAVN